MPLANFVIAGTEKAGTTAVFSYLAGHPEVCASKRKETDFFRDPQGRPETYASYFDDWHGQPVCVEASPGYLGEAATVAPRMHALIPDTRLLFILREPASRLLSSYYFHRGRLNLPEGLSFGGYLAACLRYAREQGIEAPSLPTEATLPADLDEWHLKVLLFGCYARFLEHYLQRFPRERVLVAFYDDLRADPRAFMSRISRFLDIDGSHWDTAAFAPRNVTFSSRSQLVHRLALRANDALEPVLRARPALKELANRIYKSVNQARQGYDDMGEREHRLLLDFYGPHNRALQQLLGAPLPESWPTMGERA